MEKNAPQCPFKICKFPLTWSIEPCSVSGDVSKKCPTAFRSLRAKSHLNAAMEEINQRSDEAHETKLPELTL